jgi:hypothetical protein
MAQPNRAPSAAIDDDRKQDDKAQAQFANAPSDAAAQIGIIETGAV